MSVMAKTNSKKRKSQPGAPGKGRYLSKSAKKYKKSNDVYEAIDSDPDEDKHAVRYIKVENYEYELPSDFEDEEIDEDLAFTEEDKKKFAGWFGVDNEEEQAQNQHNKRPRGEFADLDSSSEEEQDEDEEDLMEDEEAGADDDNACASVEEDQQQPQQHHANGLGVDSDDSGSRDEDEAIEDVAQQEEGEEDDDDDLDDNDDDDDGDDDGRHRAMLAAALGKDLQPWTSSGGGGGGGHSVNAAARKAAVVTEAYPESEAHASAVGELRLSDLLGGLSAGGGRSSAAGLGGARKLLEKIDKTSAPVTAPLPRTVADRLDRMAGYDDTKQEVNKWQPIVKANREAPTVRFTSARHEVSAAAASTSALVDSFTPDTAEPDGMEAQVAALLGAAGGAAAAAMAEAEQKLAEKAYSAEEAKARADRLAKMRNLMFYAELKAKRLSKIKSKEHHRRANRAAKRAAARAADAAGDEQAEAQAATEEAEFERAKERLTLKHKNSSKWARRALKRGAAVLDVSTREALAAQLALGQQLRRKMEGSRGEAGSSEGGDDSTSASEPEDNEAVAAAASTGRLMSSRSRKEALDILKGLATPAAAAAGDGLAVGGEGSNISQKKGLFALPFMVRALEKQRAAAAQEAAALLADMEGGEAAAAAASTAADDFMAAAAGDSGGGGAAGRMTFGGPAGAAAAARAAAVATMEALSGSDSEEDVDAKAARLTSHIAGDAAAAATAAGAAAVGNSSIKPAAASSKQQPVLDSVKGQQRQRQQEAPEVGTVEIELPCQAHADLFVGQQRQRQQQQQQRGDVASSSQAAAFVPCRTWQGVRDGYVFKSDSQGLGYYRDSKTQQQSPAAHSSRRERQQQHHHNGGAKQMQPLLQRQLHGKAAEDGGSDEKSTARAHQHPTGAGAGNKHNGAAPRPTAASAAGAAVDAMQLMSGEGDLQRQLLAAAFAADDVEGDFAAEKAAEVAEELPSDRVEGQLPGWGTWKTQQREPTWMTAAKAKAAAQRAAAAAARKDAQMKHVIISEKWDKKSAKYLAASLPFPFKDKLVYETAIRQPLGRQYNPDAAFRNLTRPAVLKDAGVVIEPLRHSKHVEQYNSSSAGRGRAVVTVAGGMQLQGQAAGSGAGAVGKGGGRKGKGNQQQHKAGSASAGFKRGRLPKAP